MCKIYSVDLNYEQTVHDTLAFLRSIKSFIQHFTSNRTQDYISREPPLSCKSDSIWKLKTHILKHFFLLNYAILEKVTEDKF